MQNGPAPKKMFRSVEYISFYASRRANTYMKLKRALYSEAKDVALCRIIVSAAVCACVMYDMHHAMQYILYIVCSIRVYDV